MSLPGYDAWKTTDPDLEYDHCPECDAPLEGDKYEGHCTEEDCDYTYEADYEAIIEAREAYRDFMYESRYE